eukprot:2926344-Alexandrium_andersonii.AAC.1
MGSWRVRFAVAPVRRLLTCLITNSAGLRRFYPMRRCRSWWRWPQSLVVKIGSTAEATMASQWEWT